MYGITFTSFHAKYLNKTYVFEKWLIYCHNNDDGGDDDDDYIFFFI